MSTGQKFLVAIGLGCCLSALAAVAAGTGFVTLSGHVPSVVSQLTPAGSLAATNRLNLAIGLPLRNQAALATLMQQLYDPASPKYRQYLTPEQFTEQFGPTTNDYQAVVDFARANGMIVTKLHGNRMLVDVVADVAAVQKGFHVKMNVYHHPKEARDFYSPDTEPVIDSTLSILHVQGLDNYLLPHSLMVKKQLSGGKPGNGSAPFGAYMGQDFRNAYAPGSPFAGSGQIVGLLQFDGYFPSDIATYESIAGLTNVPLQNVLLDGFDGTPGGGNGEVCLDIENSISMAPALSSVVVFMAGPFGNPDDILNAMAASNHIKQLSASWAYQTDPVSEQIYKQFALQGQTFLNASGDGDAWLGGIPWGALEDTNITLVGGTTLTMNGVGNSYQTERAWNWGYYGPNAFNPDGYWGTSGGVSLNKGIPSWQTNFINSLNNGSTSNRNTPDVALTADNVFIVADDGQEEVSGGTSSASPLWAGFMALVNQSAAAHGVPSVGFLAPQVYALAKTPQYNVIFHDIVTGSNTWDQSLTNFYAVPGYDLCTGLGTPNGTNMINALVGNSNPIPTNYVPLVTAPPEPYGTTLSALNGGSPNGTWALFIQDDVQYNTGMISNGWSITLTLGSPLGGQADNGIGMSASAGTVSPGGSLTYYLNVTNYGGLSASTNVIVEDALPKGAAYLASHISRGSNTITGDLLSGYHMVWYVGNLNDYDGATASITVAAPAAPGTIYNYGFVSATTPDPNPADDSVTLPVQVGSATPPQLTGNYNHATGVITLNIGGSGGTVIIQTSTNLQTWVPVYTGTTPYTFTDTNSGNQKSLFYRAVTSP